MINLAIVGSTSLTASDKVVKIIAKEIERLRPDIITSGGAKGIDSIGAEIAKGFGYIEDVNLIIHLPENPRWEPDGYRQRNMLIAHDCTHLIAIRDKNSKTYGSGWTADCAEEMGKIVKRILI